MLCCINNCLRGMVKCAAREIPEPRGCRCTHEGADPVYCWVLPATRVPRKPRCDQVEQDFVLLRFFRLSATRESNYWSRVFCIGIRPCSKAHETPKGGNGEGWRYRGCIFCYSPWIH